MSYDLHLLRVPPGEDVSHVLDLHLDAQDEELNPGPLVPALEDEKQRLAKALMQFNPALRIAAFDYAGLAAMYDIDEREARRRYRHVEVNADDYTGIQITLWDSVADVTFPYWHAGEQARRVLLQVWDYLALLQSQGGFVLYDPQLERVIDLDVDFDAVLAFCLE